MPTQPPCIAWAEKLALRYEDLAPDEQAALDAHLSTCAACRAARSDYHFLDARLRALPPPVIKPFPRLFLPAALVEETPNQGGREWPARQFPGAGRHPRQTGAFPTLLKKVLGGILIASLILILLIAFQGRSINLTAAHGVGTTLLTYDRHSDYVDAVAWSPDGRYIASGSWDDTVQVWDAKTGALLFSYRQNGIVDAVAWSPDGRYIASGSWDDTVQVWDVLTQHLVRIYTGHSDFVTALAWSPDSQYIASGSWDDTLQVWNAQTGALDFKYIYNAPELPEEINAVAWSPNGKYIAVGGKDEYVHILNAQTGIPLNAYWQQSVVNAVAWSPDSTTVASGDRAGLVQVWQATTGKPLLTYKGHSDQVFAVAWSPDGRYIASGSVDHTVQVWQATTGLPILTYRGHSNDVAALAWSPNSRYLASGSWDDTVQVWQATYGG